MTDQPQTKRPPAQFGDSNVRRRHAAMEQARDTMEAYGVRWADVKAWALANGWKPADVASVNPLAVEKWAEAQP